MIFCTQSIQTLFVTVKARVKWIRLGLLAVCVSLATLAALLKLWFLPWGSQSAFFFGQRQPFRSSWRSIRCIELHQRAHDHHQIKVSSTNCFVFRNETFLPKVATTANRKLATWNWSKEVFAKAIKLRYASSRLAGSLKAESDLPMRGHNRCCCYLQCNYRGRSIGLPCC